MEQDEGLLAKLLKEIAELEIQQALYLKLEKEGYKFLGDIVIRTEAELLAHSRATVTFLEQKRTKKVRKNKNLKNRIWKRVKIILEKTFNLRAILDLSFFFKHTFEKKRFF